MVRASFPREYPARYHAPPPIARAAGCRPVSVPSSYPQAAALGSDDEGLVGAPPSTTQRRTVCFDSGKKHRRQRQVCSTLVWRIDGMKLCAKRGVAGSSPVSRSISVSLSHLMDHVLTIRMSLQPEAFCSLLVG